MQRPVQRVITRADTLPNHIKLHCERVINWCHSLPEVAQLLHAMQVNLLQPLQTSSGFISTGTQLSTILELLRSGPQVQREAMHLVMVPLTAAAAAVM